MSSKTVALLWLLTAMSYVPGNSGKYVDYETRSNHVKDLSSVPERVPLRGAAENVRSLSKHVPEEVVKLATHVPVRSKRSKRSVIKSENCARGEIWFLVSCIRCEIYEEYTGESC